MIHYDFPPPNFEFQMCWNEFRIADVLEMNYPAKDCPKQLLSTEASSYELLTTLDTNKSTSCDVVSANMLKQTACSIALLLSNLINISLLSGKVYHGKVP